MSVQRMHKFIKQEIPKCAPTETWSSLNWVLSKHTCSPCPAQDYLTAVHKKKYRESNALTL